jgi:ketosteroid isomerase-like protein
MSETDAADPPPERELLADARRGDSAVDAFVDAWEREDIPALLRLLAEDARFSMPPLPAWFDGQVAIARFCTRMFARPWRLVPIRANGQLAFACYQRETAGQPFRLGAINVVTLRRGRIAELTGFLDPAVHRRFALPSEVDG